MNRKLEIFTDGGCRHNPGIGAWAFIVAEDDEVVYQLSGSQGITTNNEMELMAIYEAEMWLHENADDADDVIIYSDS